MKRISLIVFLTSCISGCASFSRQYEMRPFFSEFGQKFDCGNGIKTASNTLCRLDVFGY